VGRRIGIDTERGWLQKKCKEGRKCGELRVKSEALQRIEWGGGMGMDTERGVVAEEV
jgi:hypothetical protein